MSRLPLCTPEHTQLALALAANILTGTPMNDTPTILPSPAPETPNPLKSKGWRNSPRLQALLARQAAEAEAAKEIRAQNLTAKELNFRRRLPKGHPDRIESK